MKHLLYALTALLLVGCDGGVGKDVLRLKSFAHTGTPEQLECYRKEAARYSTWSVYELRTALRYALADCGYPDPLAAEEKEK